MCIAAGFYRQKLSTQSDRKIRELDRQLLGLFVTRAAVLEVVEDGFFEFMGRAVAP